MTDARDDLLSDIDAIIHAHCGDDGMPDEHNDWVHDLANAIVAVVMTTDPPPCPTCAKVREIVANFGKMASVEASTNPPSSYICADGFDAIAALFDGSET